MKDGNRVNTIKANGVILSTVVFLNDNYGKYYMIEMSLQNYSGKSKLLTLRNVKAEGLIYDKKTGILKKRIPLTILNANQYDKKVARKQGWGQFWAGLAEGMAAYNAGYSQSTTTYNGSSLTTGSASAYGNVGNTYGYANVFGSSYTTSYGQAHTTTYNGAAAYAAQQQANANYNNYVNNQRQLRQQLNEGYVKDNTIQDNVDYSGYFNIKYEKVDHMKVTFTIDGEPYTFIY